MSTPGRCPAHGLGVNIFMQRRTFIVIFTLLWLVAGSAAPADEKSTGAVVESLHDSLLTMMKDADALGFEGRREYMAPVVAQSFNLPVIAIMASGPNWSKFNETQHERLIGALEHLSVTTYAAGFNGYSGETFRVLAEQPGPQGAVFVNSELAMRRLEYAAGYKRDGFEGLLAAIEQKSADYAAGLLQ